MIGRFSTRRVAAEPAPVEAPTSAGEATAWAAFPEPAAEPAAQAANPNPLLSDRLLDAKVRLHRRLIE